MTRRDQMTVEEAVQIGEMVIKGKDNFYIAGKLGKSKETVKSYTRAFRLTVNGEPVTKVNRKIFTEACAQLKLREPTWKKDEEPEKEAQAEEPVKEPEQLPGQLEMDLPIMLTQDEEINEYLKNPPVFHIPRDTYKLEKIEKSLDSISRALWALVKGGEGK